MKKIALSIIFLLFSCDRDWSYHGANPPQKWGDIAPKYKFCKIGFNQSPIDIDATMLKDFVPLNFKSPDLKSGDLKFNYQSAEIEKFKQKFNLKINFYGKSFLWRGKKKYWLRSLEFHHPSEHLIASEPHSLEMQIYHKSDDEQWLILSYFIEIDTNNIDQQNLSFTPLINFLQSKNIEDKFNLVNLVSENNLSFFYEGSFTTPPCTEGVKWYIMKKPLFVSKEQLNILIKTTIFTKSNARNVQKYHPENF